MTNDIFIWLEFFLKFGKIILKSILGNAYESFAANNYPLRGAKMTLWEGGTRTPAMIHSPTYLPSGKVSDLWLHVTDW